MKSPIITMSAITGTPTKDEIFRYMNSLQENGIRQVMLYPRSGCEIPYLSDAWFETIQNFILSAEALHMNIWLYDDFNWPSGQAGGVVTEIEAFRLKTIFIRGENAGTISCASTQGGSIFDEKFFPDLFSEEAVDYFIACTYEKYFEKFAPFFGTVIQGFFTDEPATAYCCTDESIPYYNGMEEEYAKRFGRSFSADIQEEYEGFTELAFRLIADRFRTCYLQKLQQWCLSHNIVLTGHLMCDNTPFHATLQNGDYLRNLSAFSVPGIDEIETNLRHPTLFTLLGGTQYAAGEKGAMAELFALGPCDLSYATKRCMIYLASCFKIDHYFLAISHLDIRGNQYITDFFNDFSADQPDFSGMQLLSDEAICASRYAKKDFVPDVYIRYPQKVCAKNYLAKPDMMPFHNIANRLSYYQLQWKLINHDDDAEHIPVIDFNDQMAYVLGDTITDDVEKICSMIEKQILVTDQKGDLPEGIFVRKYQDGSFVVLNLYAPSGVYRISGKEVFLDQHAVFTDEDFANPDAKEQRQPVSAKFRVRYESDNMIRAMYINDETKFTLFAESEKTVRFAVRKNASVRVNQTEIPLKDVQDELTDGLKQLYHISPEISLKKGENIIESGVDFKYLPSIFLLGDFSAVLQSGDVCGMLLKERQATYTPGEFFSDFGKVTFHAEVTVPKGAKALEIRGTKRLTAVSTNGTALGKKICAPYVFPLQSTLQGTTIRLAITQYASLGSIFGDVAYYDNHANNVKWSKTPVPEKDVFGFAEIHWVLES